MVNPKIWGEAGWKFLFSIVADYPDNPGIDMQHHYKRFFFHMRWVLPCDVCRDNYDHHFRKWQIDSYLKSRPALFRWLANIYNETRRDQGQPPLSDHQILHKFFGDCGQGVPEEMIVLLCSARGPEWQGYDPSLEGGQEGGGAGGRGGAQEGRGRGAAQEGGGSGGGALQSLLAGQNGQNLLDRLGVSNPSLLLVLLVLLGVYYYLFTRRTR